MHIQHYKFTAIQTQNLQALINAQINPILAKIFVSRGINHRQELETSLANLPHPHSMLGAKQGGELLADAIEQNLDIVIVADYDCDGATSCAVAIKGIKQLSLNNANKVNFIVPNRFIHGYGLTPEIVDVVLAKYPNTSLLITVDNGISSIEGVIYAKQKGLQVLITDHHLTTHEIPPADVVVNPNQPNCTFSSKNIAGVGVIFYVLMATRIALRERNFYAKHNNLQPRLDNLLDLVALGTIADVVKLDNVNRCLVHNGLAKIQKGLMQVGVKSLIEVSGKNYLSLNSQDLGFALAPRLNAAGRLEDMSMGINCLISEDINYAMQIAHSLNQLNNERKNIEGEIKEEINLHMQDIQLNYPALCLYGEYWHQGVIGIVASRFKDKYHVPTLIFANNSDINDGLIKGSGRSIAGFHMRDAIDYISKLHPHIIIKFGGHAMAAGLTLKYEYFDEFCQAFYTYTQNNLTNEHLKQIIYIDEELPANQHNLSLIKLLQQQVWGQGFTAPIFANTFKIIEQTLLKNQHLKLKLSLQGQIFTAIWFFHNQYIATDSAYIIYELSCNTWQQKQEIQLLVKYIT